MGKSNAAWLGRIGVIAGVSALALVACQSQQAAEVVSAKPAPVEGVPVGAQPAPPPTTPTTGGGNPPFLTCSVFPCSVFRFRVTSVDCAV